ncbi:MAG: ribonuclease P protein component [Pseudomonadales bacterium]
MASPDLGFPRSARLLNARDFNNVFRNATLRRRSGALRLSAVANRMPVPAGARLGLVVGKRAISRAHERNRVKRVLRETFRQRRAQLPAMDIVMQITEQVDNETLRMLADQLLAEVEACQR